MRFYIRNIPNLVLNIKIIISNSNINWYHIYHVKPHRDITMDVRPDKGQNSSFVDGGNKSSLFKKIKKKRK